MALTDATRDAVMKVSELLDMAETDEEIVEMVLAATSFRCLRDKGKDAGDRDKLNRVTDMLSRELNVAAALSYRWQREGLPGSKEQPERED